MESSDSEVADALLSAWEWLAGSLPEGWSSRFTGAVAAVTGVSVPTLNGVWASSVDDEAFRASLSLVAATGLAYCAQFPVGSELAARAAVGRGMLREEDVPLMRLDGAPLRGLRGAPEGLNIRRLAPAEAIAHADAASRGFGAPADLFRPFASEEIASKPEIAFYLGEVNGLPVTTGLGLLLGESVGIFNVATPPECRGRGYGGALTAQIIRESRSAGATWSWLQSSAVGNRLYDQIGFRTVARWECWVSAGP